MQPRLTDYEQLRTNANDVQRKQKEGAVPVVHARVLLLAACTAAVLLRVCAPSPTGVLRASRTGASAADPTALLVAALALAAHALVLWLVAAVLATLAARLPGLPGRLGAVLARRCAPAAVRRGLELALGVTVTVGTLAGSPALAATSTGPSPVPGGTSRAAADVQPRPSAVPRVPDLDWPVGATPSAPGPAAPVPPGPSPQSPADPGAVAPSPAAAPEPPPDPPSTPRSPADPASPSTGAPVRPSTSPAARSSTGTGAGTCTAPAARAAAGHLGPAVPPGTPARSAPPDPRGGRPPAPVEHVVVQPGDTLWSIAATALARADRPTTAPAVARAWPTWWAANREVIGDDPDLILPGTSLVAPGSSPAATPSPSTAAAPRR